MSTFTGINTMTRGIYVNQISLNTVGHNITNADTDGYSKQTVNPGATQPEYRQGFAIGTGVDALSLTRARDVYADVQYRVETSNSGYYEMTAKNYDKLEAIFNDSTDSGIQNALEEFYKSWVSLSTNASDSSNRVAVIEKGKAMADMLETASAELRNQISDKYNEIEIHVVDMNQIMEDIAHINGIITSKESDGASANDLRDKRDLLVDQLAKYINLAVHEDEFGAYDISTGGITLISGSDRLHLDYAKGVDSASYGVDYGVIDYQVNIRESDVVFLPQNGLLKAEFDAIDKCREYIDAVSNIATFMLTTFNDQHKQGYDLTGATKNAKDDNFDNILDSEGNIAIIPDSRNFYGETGKQYIYNYDEINKYAYITIKNESTGIFEKDNKGNILKLTGVKIISAMKTNVDFEETGGYRYIAAATSYDEYHDFTSATTLSEMADHHIDWEGRTADGRNAVYISELFNMTIENITSGGRANVPIVNKYADTFKTLNALGGLGINSYYKSQMTKLGVEANAMDVKIKEQELVMDQIQNWRDSTAGVDWNEELADMLKYQKGFGACSRCMSAMDECLDRLINSTGVAGR